MQESRPVRSLRDLSFLAKQVRGQEFKWLGNLHFEEAGNVADPSDVNSANGCPDNYSGTARVFRVSA